jgi:hypothetical protein
MYAGFPAPRIRDLPHGLTALGRFERFPAGLNVGHSDRVLELDVSMISVVAWTKVIPRIGRTVSWVVPVDASKVASPE